MKITADFARLTGNKIKPMHGIGQPPMIFHDDRMFHYLSDAGMPYSRLHDVCGWLGGDLYVDIPNLFRDFDADENDPTSYDFAFTDWLIETLMKHKCEPVFRLGVTIENEHLRKAYRIFPPADFGKWARICEHVIRHYNEGWADGYHFGIQYWEIWNEPDDCWKTEYASMWRGTAEQFYELYAVTANHLKNCFGDTIKVGGYGCSGFYGMPADEGHNALEGADPFTLDEYFIIFMRDFLKYISSDEHKAPLDFFSWHSYSPVHMALEQAEYCRWLLNRYGFENTEDICNEWNTSPHVHGRREPEAAAKILAMMCGMQRQTTAMLNFYDGRIAPSDYGGLFNPDTLKPYPAYYAMMMFNRAYQMGMEIESTSDTDGIYTLAATKDGKSVLLIANISGEAQTAELDLRGVNLSHADITRIDTEYCFQRTGETVTDNLLRLPYGSCVELFFH